MTAKQYLNRVRYIEEEISALLRMVHKTRMRLVSITQNYDSDGAQITKDPHKYDRLVELESMVDERIDAQINLKAEITNTIMQLSDRNQRIVLISHYLSMDKWGQTAALIHRSYKQTLRIHGYALKEIEKIINRNEES